MTKAKKEVESRIDKKKSEKTFYIDGKTKQILSIILPGLVRFEEIVIKLTHAIVL